MALGVAGGNAAFTTAPQLVGTTAYSAPPFLTKALGSPHHSAPLARRPAEHTSVRIARSSYTVVRSNTSVSLAAEDVGSQGWRHFANGASRPTAFGLETVIVDRTKAEQFLTVDEHQGPKTWSWALRASNVRPRLRADGAVEFLAGGKLSGLFIPAVAVFDAQGQDITPAGSRWSLVRRGSSWWLELRLDDSRLPLPYVVDPAIAWKSSSTAGNSGGATTLTIAKPAGVLAGDFLIAQVTVRDNPTITAPAGWTLVRSDLNTATLKQSVYRKVATATEPLSYTWGFSSSQRASGGISAYTGVDTGNPVDTSSGATGNGPLLTAPSVTTSVADEMVVGFYGIALSTTLTPQVGMTERFQVNSGGAGGAATHTHSMSADFTQATAGPTGPRSATDGTTGAAWVAQLVALRPAKHTTMTTVSCTPPSVPVGSSTTCTATVTDTSTAPTTPTGLVSFFEDASASAFASCTLVGSGATASCQVAYTPTVLGVHTIRADYGGDGSHFGSTGTTTVIATKRATATSVSCADASVPVGSSTQCTATVRDLSPGTASTPTGLVSFFEDASATAFASCTLVGSGGTASCQVAYTPTVVGAHTIRADYGGDGSHLGSTGTTTVIATERATATTVDCADATVPVDAGTSCTATVRDVSPGTASAPTGTVSWSSTPAEPNNFSATSCTLTATGNPGEAQCSVTFTPHALGPHVVKGDYGGDSTHLGSSGEDTVTATNRSTSTSVSCTPSTVPVDAPTTCTATVSDTDRGTQSSPSGTVLFASSGAGTFSSVTCTLGGTGNSSSCAVTYTPTAVGTGTHTITATYGGDTTHLPSEGTTSITVTKRSTSTSVSCSPASFQAGGSTLCTATVVDTDSGAKSAPEGSVSFTADGSAVPFGDCVLVPSLTAPQSSCSATFTSTKAATHTITATYGGDAKHAGSSGSTTVTVTPGPPAIVTVSPPTATNQVDTQHCVTAKVTDVFLNPTPGVKVFFSVIGSNRASGSRTTDADGTTPPFCYVGRLFGVDTITAVADRDRNNQPDPTEPRGEATKEWLLPVSTPLCNVDFPTYGGHITADNGDMASFGGNAHVDAARQSTGQEQYTDHGPANPMDVHSTSVLAVVCVTSGGFGQADIYGEATVDGSGSHKFRISVEDHGEPGTSDTYWIVLSNGYDSGRHVLDGGNVQVH